MGAGASSSASSSDVSDAWSSESSMCPSPRASLSVSSTTTAARCIACAVTRVNRLLDRRPHGMRAMLHLIAIINETSPQQKLDLVECGVFRRICKLVYSNSQFDSIRKCQHNEKMEENIDDRQKEANKNKISGGNTITTEDLAGVQEPMARVAFVSETVAIMGSNVSNITDTSTNSNILDSSQKSKSNSSRGVGYGRGSTKSQWNFKRTLKTRIAQEEHLMWLLCTLSVFLWSDNNTSNNSDTTKFINKEKDESRQPHFCAQLIRDLVESAQILQLLENRLCNDSVFDISQHIDFYQALLELAAGLSRIPQFIPLLIRPVTTRIGNTTNTTGSSIARELIPCFRQTLNTFEQLARGSDSPDFVLMEFIRKVNEYADIIARNIDQFDSLNSNSASSKVEEYVNAEIHANNVNVELAQKLNKKTVDASYVEALKELQFQTQRLITEENKGMGYAFRKELRNVPLFSGTPKHRTKRITKELASMHNALPLSSSSSIFVCVDESRCDVLKVLISGPEDTPYQDGLFEFDIFFPNNYPISPPKCAFVTTGNGTIRFNPNLYSDGKICLSILGTWEGRPEEKWNSFCSILQVLVSIQGLIFVKNPYFNEPGLEKLEGTPEGDSHSRRYNVFLEYATLIHAIEAHYRNPPAYFCDVIRRHFWLKRDAIIARAEHWLIKMARRTSHAEDDVELFDSMALMESDAKNVYANTVLLAPLMQRQNVRKLIEDFRAMKNPFD